MKVRLYAPFSKEDNRLNLILDKNGSTQCLVGYYDYDDISEHDFLLIQKFVTNMNAAFEKMWH